MLKIKDFEFFFYPSILNCQLFESRNLKLENSKKIKNDIFSGRQIYPTFYPSIRNATFDGTLCTERKPRPKKNKVEWHQLRQKASTLLLSISFIRMSKKEFIFTKVLSKPHLTNEFRSGLIFQVQDVLYL